MLNQSDRSVIVFPERIPVSGIATYETDKLIHETKMACIRPLNQAAAGLCKISEEEKESLRNLNVLCREFGHSILLTEEEIDQL